MEGGSKFGSHSTYLTFVVAGVPTTQGITDIDYTTMTVEYFELETRPNGTDLISTMNGIFQTGGLIGTLVLPWIADQWGRRWALAIVS
jgi:MFS family permease